MADSATSGASDHAHHHSVHHHHHHHSVTPQILSFPDAQALSTGLDEYVAKLSAEAIKHHDKFTVALSGGSLPKQLSAVLRHNTSVDFSKWIVYFADERCVPLDHEDSNYLLAKNELFNHVNIPEENIHPIDASLSPEDAAEDYISQLAKTFATRDSVRYPVFDLILLGVGPDGHTCSLFPGHELLNETSVWCAAITDSPKPPPERITLTFPVLNHAHHVAFVAAGAGKQDILQKILDPASQEDLPARSVKPSTGSLTWFVDDAAAGKITSLITKGLQRL
ncbi:6-phosphogluconolactonase [Mortierella sp. GBAus27b]|nr:6-phosphogluconolactonase [Mortierella sp. GBA43]KAI8348518.1 6-phosphogluconolactonase [Mortierella sp. GBAus27b]